MVPPFRLPTHLSTLRNSDLALERRFVDYLRLSKSVGVHPDLEEGMKVLDVGCGKGLAVYDMARIVGPNGRVVGVDVLAGTVRIGTPLMKEDGKEIRNHRGNFITDIDSLPIPDWNLWEDIFSAKIHSKNLLFSLLSSILWLGVTNISILLFLK